LRFDCAETPVRGRGITRAAQAVSEAELVVFATDTVYGLGCDAFSRAAVNDLMAAKGRRVPPPVLVSHVRTLDALATGLDDRVRELAEAFWPGPLTLICKAQPTLDWSLGERGGTVAVRVPLHPVALQLLDRTGPLAVTGANVAGHAPADTCDEAERQLGETVSVYLDSGPAPGAKQPLSSSQALGSTVVDVTGEVPQLLRAGALGLERLRTVIPQLAAVAG
jgi:tRNA threonylcarbamoyl adenosine modification protein (Sua5/YciO/YrdC/YwlC family)